MIKLQHDGQTFIAQIEYGPENPPGLRPSQTWYTVTVDLDPYGKYKDFDIEDVDYDGDARNKAHRWLREAKKTAERELMVDTGGPTKIYLEPKPEYRHLINA